MGRSLFLEPFRKGTGQHAIAEMAAEIYDQPILAQKGGFFYHLYNSKDRVSTLPFLIYWQIHQIHECVMLF